MQPAPGRTVHYTLTAADAEQINRRRKDFAEHVRTGSVHHLRPGFVGHVGNHAQEGDTLPAMIVRVWNESTVTVNAQVFLDGNDTFWATSRAEGEGPGTWCWPPRV